MGVGAGTGAGAGAGAGAGGEEGEGGDDEGEPIMEPEKVLRNPDDKDEKLIECPSKLWRFDSSSGAGEWVDVGKGTFSVTKCSETGKQRMLIRNSVGKVVFNAAFYKGMTVNVTPKNMMTFAAVVDDTGLKKFMLKVKDTDPVLSKIKAAIASLG